MLKKLYTVLLCSVVVLVWMLLTVSAANLNQLATQTILATATSSSDVALAKKYIPQTIVSSAFKKLHGINETYIQCISDPSSTSIYITYDVEFIHGTLSKTQLQSNTFKNSLLSLVPSPASTSVTLTLYTPVIKQAPERPLRYDALKECNGDKNLAAEKNKAITEEYAFAVRSTARPAAIQITIWEEHINSCYKEGKLTAGVPEEPNVIQSGMLYGVVAIGIIICLKYIHDKKYGVKLPKDDPDLKRQKELKKEIQKARDALEDMLCEKDFEKEKLADENIEKLLEEEKLLNKKIQSRKSVLLAAAISDADAQRLAKKKAKEAAAANKPSTKAKKKMKEAKEKIDEVTDTTGSLGISTDGIDLSQTKDGIKNLGQQAFEKHGEKIIGEENMQMYKDAKNAKNKCLKTVSQLLLVISAILSLSGAVLLMNNYATGKLSILDLKVRLNGTIHVNGETITVVPEPFGCTECDYTFTPTDEALQKIAEKIPRGSSVKKEQSITRLDGNLTCEWKEENSCSPNAVVIATKECTYEIKLNNTQGYCDCGSGSKMPITCSRTGETTCNKECNKKTIDSTYLQEATGTRQSLWMQIPGTYHDLYDKTHTCCIKKNNAGDPRLFAVLTFFFCFIFAVTFLEVLAEFETGYFKLFRGYVGMTRKVSFCRGKYSYTVQELIKKVSPVLLNLPMNFLLANLQDVGESFYKNEKLNIGVYSAKSDQAAGIIQLIEIIFWGGLIIGVIVILYKLWYREGNKETRYKLKIKIRRCRQSRMRKRKKSQCCLFVCFRKLSRTLQRMYLKFITFIYGYGTLAVLVGIVVTFYILIIGESFSGNIRFGAIFFSVDFPIVAPTINLPAVYLNLAFQSINKIRIGLMVTLACLKRGRNIEVLARKSAKSEEEEEQDYEEGLQGAVDQAKDQIDENTGKIDEGDKKNKNDPQKKSSV